MDTLSSTIFCLSGPRVLTLAEAQRLVPIITKMTERTQREVQILMGRLEATRSARGDLVEVEDLIDSTMEQWRSQVSLLGGHPKGVWAVDFDNGSGYFCWKYPEREILFEHGYKDGYLGRRPLQPRRQVLPEVLENEA